MIPVPVTELVAEGEAGPTIISYHLGVCKAATLNATGIMVWNLMDGKRTIRQIAALVATATDTQAEIDVGAVTLDVESFIAALEKEGFVRLEPQHAPGGNHDAQTA